MALTAVRLTYEATTTSRAPCTASSARVPFVVVSRTVFPSTTSRVCSAGELPRSNPSIFSMRRSPASNTPARSNCFERVTTSSELSSGMTVRAPFASATAIVVEARSTSIIATTRPWTSCVPRCSAPHSTSMRTLRRLLHQLRLPLQELRVHVAALESGVLHDAREEGDGGRRPLDDEGFQCEPHLRQRLFTVASLTDDLGDHRIVERRHRVAGVDVRVETHTVAARRMERHDATRGRLEVSVPILGVDATLDDVAAKRWQLVNAERMACRDTDLLLHEIDPGQHLRHRMLDLDPRVHP